MDGFPFWAWHGTPHGPFDRFRLPGDNRSGADAVFVTQDRRVAEMYALSRYTQTCTMRAIAEVRVRARRIFDYADAEQARRLMRELPREHRPLVPVGSWSVLERDLTQTILKEQGYDAFMTFDAMLHGKNIGVFDPNLVEITGWHALEFELRERYRA